MNDTPTRISIITPCLNREGYIARAIESVLDQTYPNIEHIVVDGGSTDQTLSILAGYPHIRLISGPDEGIYDALNKGLQLASGDIVGFLNSDDFYAEDIFHDVAESFCDPKIQAVTGEAIAFSQTLGDEIVPGEHFLPQNADLLHLVTIGNPFFNAWFFRRAIFGQIGRFDTSYRITADREFMLRFALSRPNYVILPKLVYCYQQHVDSLTFELTDQKFERIGEEHTRLTGHYLAQKRLPQPARAFLRKLRTRETAKMAALSIKAKKLSNAIYFARAGLQYDPTWLFYLVCKVLGYAFKKIQKVFKGISFISNLNFN